MVTLYQVSPIILNDIIQGRPPPKQGGQLQVQLTREEPGEELGSFRETASRL